MNDDYDDATGIWDMWAANAALPNPQPTTPTKKKAWVLLKKPVKKPVNKPIKAKTINAHQDQDYIDTLSGVTKVAVLAISELVNQGKADFLFLRDDDTKDFWDKHLTKMQTVRANKAEKERQQQVKADALAKLTPEEKKLLGIKP